MRERITDSIQFWISVVQYIFFRKHTLQSKITSKRFHFKTISTIVILLKFSFDGTIMNVYIDSNVDLFKIKKKPLLYVFLIDYFCCLSFCIETEKHTIFVTKYFDEVSIVFGFRDRYCFSV